MKKHILHLLNELQLDEKEQNQEFYSAGSYWKSKTVKTALEIQRKGINDFRGYDSGVGTSFCDNVISNPWNETVSHLKNILLFISRKLPLLKRIGKIQKETSALFINMHKQKMNILSAWLKETGKARRLLENYTLENTTDFGCVEYIEIDSNKMSTHYLELLHTQAVIDEKINLNDVRSMFEIGGGFGANAHIMLQNYKNLKKIIYLDIVPNLVVGTEYLRSFYGESVYDYLSLKNKKTIQFSNDDSLEIFCIAPWQIEILDCKIDYFHNANSFVEMPESIAQNYLKYLETLLSPNAKIALVSYSGFDLNTTWSPTKLKGMTQYRLKEFKKPCLVTPYKDQYYFLSN